MVKTTLSFIVIFLILSGIALGGVMPVPTSQEIFAYDPQPIVMSTDPNTAKPIGVGSVATGGDTFSFHIGLSQFSGPVDVYVALSVPSIDPYNIYFLTSDYSLQPVYLGLVPWKKNTPIDENPFGDISISGFPLPAGTYYLYLAVTPADSLESFYIWSTYFIVQCPYVGGTWQYSETRQCICAGEPGISTVSKTAPVTITQNACNVSYEAVVPYPGLSRNGTLTGKGNTGIFTGYTIEVSGPSSMDFEGVTYSKNTYTASGTISGNEITMNGSGIDEGKSCDEFGCYNFSCTIVADTVRFIR